jgi:hypothetical protein
MATRAASLRGGGFFARRGGAGANAGQCAVDHEMASIVVGYGAGALAVIDPVKLEAGQIRLPNIRDFRRGQWCSLIFLMRDS